VAFGRKKKNPAIADEDLIVFNNVAKQYSSGSAALNGVSLTIKRGEFVFIVGESGAGKSTLIRLLMRELVPTQGEIYVNGYNLKKLRRRQVPKYRRNIGVVFQDFKLIKNWSVFENVAFAQRIVQTPNRLIKRNVPAILGMVGLAGKYNMKPGQLAGGEQQRVAMARALINKPPILLCDEPTGNLDPANSWEIMKLLDQINKRGTTVIVVTHNDVIVNEMKKRVITLKKGAIVNDEEEGGYVNED